MNVKSMIALVLSICLFLCCAAGCDDQPAGNVSGTQPGTDSEQENTSHHSDPTESTGNSEDLLVDTQRQQLYHFISSVIIPEKGLADLSKFTWTHEYMTNGVNENWQALQENGRHGLVSAVVRDFDLDGNQDLVAFYLGGGRTCDTWVPIYGENDRLESHIVSMELYTLDGGDVILSDSYHCLNQLDDASWGHVAVYLEKLEDGIYIDSFSTAEDYSTYGASPRTIFHVEDGKFVFDYISGIGYGQGSLSTNPNHLMGTTNIDPSEYTFDARNSDSDHVRSVLYLEFTNEDYSAGTMSYTGTDYTQLRTILTDGLDSVTIPELPQGGKKPEDPAISATRSNAMSIANYVEEQSGCVIINVTTSVYSGNATYRFETEQYSFLSIKLNGETGALLSVTVSNNKYPVPDEWYNMKDAVIDYPELGLMRSDLDLFYGMDVSMNKYTNGVEITGGKAAIRQISSTDFVLEIYE